MSSNNSSWRVLKDWFEFFLILAALYGCGYIALNQLFYLYLMLFLGGIDAGLSPVVSPFYHIPNEWIGLAPSFNRLSKISRNKLDQLDKLTESELKNTKEEFRKAKKIIDKYVRNHPNLVNQYSQLRSIEEITNTGEKTSNEKYSEKVDQRQRNEEEQRKQRQKKEEQYLQRVNGERKRKGLKLGVPPNEDKCSCPPGYAIRATENLKDKNYRGIYYFPRERKRKGVEVAWCFKNEQEAEKENFRRPLKTPPK